MERLLVREQPHDPNLVRRVGDAKRPEWRSDLSLRALRREATPRPSQALVEAFYLELIAPDEGKAKAAAILAAEFATDLDEPTINTCRAAARERYEVEESNGII